MSETKSIYNKECKKIKWVKRFKAGYILQREFITSGSDGIWMTVAYNYNGDYIGNNKSAYRLCKKFGIKPEKSQPTHNICSIGFCEKEQKWYGWSHRALYGYGIGHIAKKGNCETTSGNIDEYLKEHPEEDVRVPIGFKVNTLEDAKKCAIAFAESVS